MKNYLAATLLLFVSLIGLGQSKYDFQTGFDSLAFHHHIKTKRTYSVILDSTVIDTNSVETHSYDSSGYLNKIEVQDLHNMRRNPSSFLNKKTAQFEYNEAGYLINEVVNWGGPVGSWGKDTVKRRKIEDWAYIKHSELLMSSETVNNYPDEEEWIEKCNYSYLSDNRMDKIVCYVSMADESNKLTTRYRYNHQGLLIEIQYESTHGIFRITLIEYEFYH